MHKTISSNLYLACRSPDLNPIELVWHALKEFVRRQAKPWNKDELLQAIVTFWRDRLTKTACNNTSITFRRFCRRWYSATVVVCYWNVELYNRPVELFSFFYWNVLYFYISFIKENCADHNNVLKPISFIIMNAKPKCCWLTLANSKSNQCLH